MTLNNGKPAARKGDPTEHGGDLADGPGSPNVLIGGKRAWRGEDEDDDEKDDDKDEEGDDKEGEGEGDQAKGDEAGGDQAKGDQPAGDQPAGDQAETKAPEGEKPEGGGGEGGGDEGGDIGKLVEKVQEQMDHVKAVLDFISKARDLAKKDDTPAKPGEPPPPPDDSKGIEFGRTLFEMIKDFKQVFAKTEPDEHDCPTGGHGTGKTKASQKNVLVNNLPLCRKGDKVDEPGGGEDEITEGCDSVLVGDDNKVIELAEKIGGLMDFINTAKDALKADAEKSADAGKSADAADTAAAPGHASRSRRRK